MTTSAGARNIGFVVLFIWICCDGLMGQYHDYGKITFERKTNLLKRYNDNRMKRFINEDNKIKIDKFELLFNDTASVFRPILVAGEGKMSWITTKNYYYQYWYEYRGRDHSGSRSFTTRCIDAY